MTATLPRSMRRTGQRLGFNQSAVHTDIVSTSDRTVTAVLSDGSERVIYTGGRFQLDDVDRVRLPSA